MSIHDTRSSATEDTAAEVANGTTAKKKRPVQLERYGTIVFFALMFLATSIAKGSIFYSWENITMVFAQNAHLAFCAVAITLVLIAGHFDLSVGAMAGLSSVILAQLTSANGVALPLALVVVLVIACLVGVVNGVLVTKGGINAFIVTLGMGSALGGMAIWITGGVVLYDGFPPLLLEAGTSDLFGIALPTFYAFALLGFGWFLTKRTRLGRFWYAVGSNADGARLAGVNVDRTLIKAFVATSVISAVGGMIMLARFGSADPNSGPELLLPAFAAAFLGSSILSDGRFTVIGTFVATYFLAFSQNAMELFGLSPGAKPIFNGLVLVLAVGLSYRLRRRA